MVYPRLLSPPGHRAVPGSTNSLGHMAYSLHRVRGAGAFHEAFVLELWMIVEYGCVTDSVCHLPYTLSCWELKALGTPENEVNGGKLGVRKVIPRDLKPSLGLKMPQFQEGPGG